MDVNQSLKNTTETLIEIALHLALFLCGYFSHWNLCKRTRFENSESLSECFKTDSN